MARNDPAQFDREWANAVYDYVTTQNREQSAEKRNTALLKVHETGWKLVAAAIEKGLTEIADAIRRR